MRVCVCQYCWACIQLNDPPVDNLHMSLDGLLNGLMNNLMTVRFNLKYSQISAFSALTLLVGRREGHPACKNWVVGCWCDVVIRLEWDAYCIRSSWCHCYSLSLAAVKSRLVLPFWYRLTRVVPDKGPLNGCVYSQIGLPPLPLNVKMILVISVWVCALVKLTLG